MFFKEPLTEWFFVEQPSADTLAIESPLASTFFCVIARLIHINTHTHIYSAQRKWVHPLWKVKF